jgi:hypothetical protein
MYAYIHIFKHVHDIHICNSTYMYIYQFHTHTYIYVYTYIYMCAYKDVLFPHGSQCFRAGNGGCWTSDLMSVRSRFTGLASPCVNVVSCLEHDWNMTSGAVQVWLGPQAVKSHSILDKHIRRILRIRFGIIYIHMHILHDICFFF